MSERVGIVYPWSNLDTVPSLCAAVDLLAEAGYWVDVFTKAGPGYLAPAFESDRVDVVVERPRRERRGVHRLLPGRWSSPLEAWQRHRAARYRCVIAVDPQGLQRARALFRLVPVPVAYLSLELLVIDETSTDRHRVWKEVEVEMGRRAPFVVVQDEDRADLLCAVAGLDREKVLLVPNAPRGPGRQRRSDTWHRRFRLAEDQRVVLHAGSLYPWTEIHEIVASVGSWPPGWVLVIHTRFEAEGSETVEELRRVADGGPGGAQRVFFSLNPVSRREYDALIDAAHVGIAFYDPATGSPRRDMEENIRTIGLSSGKLSYYLRAGLPVIVNDAASIAGPIARWRCGASVGSAGEIADALEKIDDDYEGYSARAVEVFDRHLDFARAFDDVIRRIDSLGEDTL